MASPGRLSALMSVQPPSHCYQPVANLHRPPRPSLLLLYRSPVSLPFPLVARALDMSPPPPPPPPPPPVRVQQPGSRGATTPPPPPTATTAQTAANLDARDESSSVLSPEVESAPLDSIPIYSPPLETAAVQPTSPASPLSASLQPMSSPDLDKDSSNCSSADPDPTQRPAILNRRSSPFPSSSPISSPRRPRRTGTTLPSRRIVSASQFESAEGLNQLSARDEFEEQFFNRQFVDNESQIINDVLEDVHFHQLEDDEELLSDDEHRMHSRRGERDPYYPYKHSTHWEGERQGTITSNWRRIPTEVGVDGCKGCERLCGENRRLRRQLDELEFELASGVLHNPADGFDPPVKAVPAIPHLPPVATKKKKGWASKFRTSTVTSVSSSKPNSERARLRSEVKALTVTTEYLWRKLNKAEMELRTYRRKDLHTRMRMNGDTRDAPPPEADVLISANGNDHDW
eukprot:TRINITY_DN444_c3_g2_i2.p3 TRINITY_DN444_c3_g2~~TRINITY_DN444_c3_g2_i2.p3  ORF type:complete len:459 (+),score=82.97 TRINITY_DN444_c3_g2_i2:10176-11552(+)